MPDLGGISRCPTLLCRFHGTEDRRLFFDLLSGHVGRRGRLQRRRPCAEPSSAGSASVIPAPGQTCLAGAVLALCFQPSVGGTQALWQLTLSLRSEFRKRAPFSLGRSFKDAATSGRETNGWPLVNTDDRSKVAQRKY